MKINKYKISSSTKFLKITFLILLFKNIFLIDFRIFSDEVHLAAYSQVDFLSKENTSNLNMNNVNSVLEILKKYDLKNSPKKLTNKDGSTTFFYRRSEDEPEKNILEIKKLIENPPDMKKYQNFIRKAVIALSLNNILIQILDLNDKDISGQWFYKDKKILIDKNSLLEGSKYFAYLLSHEMLHVSQSCKGGGFDSYPVLLGLRRNESNKSYLKKLQKPAYQNLKDNEIELEIEAYSNEKNIHNTLKAFEYFCLKQKLNKVF